MILISFFFLSILCERKSTVSGLIISLIKKRGSENPLLLINNCKLEGSIPNPNLASQFESIKSGAAAAGGAYFMIQVRHK